MENKTITIKEKISELFWCFVVFSILGMLVEMTFCYATTRVLESRQGLVWGPFCPIYGVGAVIGILILEHFKDSKIRLFVYGALIGGIVEYIISFILEAIYGTRFWDYTYLNWDLNGRICLLYSFFWGILALVIMTWIDPLFRKLAKQIQKRKTTRIVEIILFVFLVIDIICSIWAIDVYKTNAKNIYYGREEEKSIIYKIGRKLFSDDYMLKAYPNIRFMTETGEEIYIKTVINK